MKDVREKVRAIITAFGDTQMSADLIADVYFRAMEEEARERAAEAVRVVEVSAQERARQQAAERQRRKRERDLSVTERDSERDTTVTASVTVSPAPPSGSSSSDPIPSQPPERAGSISDDATPGPVARYSSNFIEFWQAYPLKVGKEAAWKAWKKQRPPLPQVMSALAWQRTSRKWKDGFIPHPATYLNEHRWLDERDGSVTKGVTSSVTTLAASEQQTAARLRDQATCQYHREVPDRASSDPYHWCVVCQRLGSRPRRVTGETEPLALGETR